MEWQPIDTAPRDGSQVLFYLGTNWVSSNDIIGWSQDDYDIVIGWWCEPNWLCGLCEEGSADTEGYGSATNIYVSPTHWMPLPEPPKE